MSSKIVDPEVTEEPVKEQVNESLEVLAVEDEVTEEEIQAQQEEEQRLRAQDVARELFGG